MNLKNFFTPLRKNAKKYTFALILLSAVLFLCTVTVIYAQESGSQMYQIESSHVSVDERATAGYSIGSLWGQYARETFTEKGVVVRVAPGASQPLYFTTSKTAATFPELTPVVQTVDLAATYPHSVELGVSSEGPLRSLDGIKIPNTSCDVGTSCDVAHGGRWTKKTSYGFGYSVDGQEYRPFNISALIFPSFFPEGSDKKERLTLKFNPAPQTPQKTYQNIVNLVISASF